MLFHQELLHKQLAGIDETFRFKDKEFLFRLLSTDNMETDALQAVWDALHSPILNSGSQKAKLQKITIEQKQIQECADSVAPYQDTIGGRLVQLKLMVILQSKCLGMLLETVPELEVELAYWNTRSNSRISVALFAMELLPAKLINWTRNKMPTSFESIWKSEPNSPRQSVAMSSVFLSLTRRIREPFSILKFSIKEIEKRREASKASIRKAAEIIGGLITFSNLTAKDIKPSIMDESLRNALGQLANDGCIYEENYAKNIRDFLENAVIDELGAIAFNLGTGVDYSMRLFNSGAPAAESLNNVISDVYRSDTNISTMVQKSARPHPLARWWFPATITGVSVLLLAKTFGISNMGDKLKDAFVYAAETLGDLWRQWIWRPCQDMLQTIRHKESKLAIMGTDSLSSDLDSLERMVVTFARDHGTYLEADLDLIRQQVRTGNLTAVLQHYEADLKNPIRSALSGDLIRSVLIQIQKGKVDGEVAISALDKILRSNELNFAFLALVPTLLITYSVVGYIRRQMGELVSSKYVLEDIRSTLIDMERIVNIHDQGKEDKLLRGKLICQVCRLRGLCQHLSRSDSKRLSRDIKDLERVIVFHQTSFDSTLVAILTRMWRRL